MKDRLLRIAAALTLGSLLVLASPELPDVARILLPRLRIQSATEILTLSTFRWSAAWRVVLPR